EAGFELLGDLAHVSEAFSGNSDVDGRSRAEVHDLRNDVAGLEGKQHVWVLLMKFSAQTFLELRQRTLPLAKRREEHGLLWPGVEGVDGVDRVRPSGIPDVGERHPDGAGSCL